MKVRGPVQPPPADIAYASPGSPPPAPLPRLKPALFIIGATAALVGYLIYFAEPTLARLFAVILVPPLATIALLIWWLRYSGAPRAAKRRAIFLMLAIGVVGIVTAERFARMAVVVWGLPTTAAAAVLAGGLAARGSTPTRRAAVVAASLIAFAPWLMLRGHGQEGGGLFRLTWRWYHEPGERLATWRPSRLPATITATAPTTVPSLTATDWPAFRGPRREGVVTGAAFDPSKGWPAPPRRWRRPVGVGWSSFAVVGQRAFTQEQRGQQECVTCYDLSTGDELWVHADPRRFEEMSGGPGPRATPAYADGRLFAQAPSGAVHCLDAATGAVLWQCTTYANSPSVPQYGVASSPLIVDNKLIAGLGGTNGVKLAALEAATGKPLWTATGSSKGYGSPHLATLGGKPQVLVFDAAGLSAHDPADGSLLWQFAWPAPYPRSVAPAILSDTDVVIGMGYGNGIKRLHVTATQAGWQVAQVWSSTKLNPKFNDVVLRDGYAYGLDEGILTCVNLADGKRAWKSGRYGYGQLLLVGAHLLIAAESGDVVVVDASPTAFREVTRFSAVEGKTWNEPVLAGPNLLVRNGEEATCFDLTAWLRP